MQIELRDISSIRPYEKNPRRNDRAVEAVARSIREFGFRQPVVIDSAGVIVVGHTRYKAAQRLGLEKVPVHVADLTAEQAKAYRIADNQSNSLAQWDEELLAAELKELELAEFDMSALGFGGDLGKWLEATPGLCDPDEVPEQPAEPATRTGDLFLLGEHRLLCGDSTRAADVERLMAGGKAAMMFTDPPWNVAIGLDSNPRHRQREGLRNDNLSPEEFQQFLSSFIAASADHIAGDVYCVLGASEWPRLDATLREHGYHWSATIIWVKDVFVLGRGKYHRRYEPIWYGWHGGCKSSFCDRRDLDDVWEIPRPKVSEEHPTMKPVELPVRAIQYSSRPGEGVLDLFGGSGSTLIAAEQLGRKAFLMELSSRYCDVIVKRWEKFTGKSAVLERTGEVE